MRDPVVMFEGKKASGFRKPKQRSKPIASHEYEKHLQPKASPIVHTTSEVQNLVGLSLKIYTTWITGCRFLKVNIMYMQRVMQYVNDQL
jgi:hypothetical protein